MHALNETGIAPTANPPPPKKRANNPSTTKTFVQDK